MVLAQVSLRVIVPLLLGGLSGIALDRIGQTAPQFVLIGLAAGTLVSILWVRAFIVSGLARMRRDRDTAAGSGPEA